MDALTLLGSALTIIGSLVAAGVFLMKTNAKLSGQLVKAKGDVYTERAERLANLVSNLEYRLKQTEEKLRTSTEHADRAVKKIEETKLEMKNFVEATEKRIKAFETVIVKINDDLIMVKSKKG